MNDSLQNKFARKKASILIVDDTGLNIDILIGILKHYDVIPALSGKEALHIVLEEKVDLILLDIVMPEMDGFEVCRRLKADERTKNIPVIIITVKNMEQDILRGYELGIVDYVAKPFNPVELLGKVKTHLELTACHLNIKTRLLCQTTSKIIANDILYHLNSNWQYALSKNADNHSVPTTSNIIEFSNILDNFLTVYHDDTLSDTFTIKNAIVKAERVLYATFHNDNIQLLINQKEPVTATGNENAYAQVMINLLSNARDMFVKRQVTKPKIIIEITMKQDKSHTLIRDNSGKPLQDDLDNLFDPTKQNTDHNHLKLFLAQSILENYGGAINCRPWQSGMEYIIDL